MNPIETIIHLGPLFARECLAIVFLYSAQDKLRHWQDAKDEVIKLSLPAPTMIVCATITTQLLGGIMVAVNFYAGVGAILLAGFTFVATLLGHRSWSLKGLEARQQFTTDLEHLAIIGGLLLVFIDSLRFH